MKQIKSLVAALLISSPLVVQAGPIYLANIVGGGDGTSNTTTNLGVNQNTGFSSGVTCTFGQTGTSNGTYHSVSSTYIDGVFVPNGTTQVTSTSITADVGTTSGKTWDYIIDGSCQSGDYYGLENYSQTSQITFHANNGITFDLDAIEANNFGFEASLFSAKAILANSRGDGVDFSVLVDGVVKATFSSNSGNLSSDLLVSLSSADRFLTLITTDGGTAYNFDQSLFADPILTLSPTSTSNVSAPSMLALLGLGLVGIGFSRRKKL